MCSGGSAMPFQGIPVPAKDVPKVFISFKVMQDAMDIILFWPICIFVYKTGCRLHHQSGVLIYRFVCLAICPLDFALLCQRCQCSSIDWHVILYPVLINGSPVWWYHVFHSGPHLPAILVYRNKSLLDGHEMLSTEFDRWDTLSGTKQQWNIAHFSWDSL